MPYGQDLAVMEKTRHAMSDTENPYCTRCGFRTYPRWGEHDCTGAIDTARIHHVGGDILANLHFYRVPVEVQVAALAEALAWTFSTNCLPNRIEAKLRAMFPIVLQVATRTVGQARPETVVQEIGKKRGLKARVKRVKAKGQKARVNQTAQKTTHARAKSRVDAPARTANSTRRR